MSEQRAYAQDALDLGEIHPRRIVRPRRPAIGTLPGALIIPFSGARESDAIGLRIAAGDVRAQGVYGMWQIPGIWSMWSRAAVAGCLWMLPQDQAAEGVMRHLTDHPEAGYPVIEQITSGAALVLASRLCPRSHAIEDLPHQIDTPEHTS